MPPGTVQIKFKIMKTSNIILTTFVLSILLIIAVSMIKLKTVIYEYNYYKPDATSFVDIKDFKVVVADGKSVLNLRKADDSKIFIKDFKANKEAFEIKNDTLFVRNCKNKIFVMTKNLKSIIASSETSIGIENFTNDSLYVSATNNTRINIYKNKFSFINLITKDKANVKIKNCEINTISVNLANDSRVRIKDKVDTIKGVYGENVHLKYEKVNNIMLSRF